MYYAVVFDTVMRKIVFCCSVRAYKPWGTWNALQSDFEVQLTLFIDRSHRVSIVSSLIGDEW